METLLTYTVTANGNEFALAAYDPDDLKAQLSDFYGLEEGEYTFRLDTGEET